MGLPRPAVCEKKSIVVSNILLLLLIESGVNNCLLKHRSIFQPCPHISLMSTMKSVTLQWLEFTWRRWPRFVHDDRSDRWRAHLLPRVRLNARSSSSSPLLSTIFVRRSRWKAHVVKISFSFLFSNSIWSAKEVYLRKTPPQRLTTMTMESYHSSTEELDRKAPVGTVLIGSKGASSIFDEKRCFPQLDFQFQSSKRRFEFSNRTDLKIRRFQPSLV